MAVKHQAQTLLSWAVYKRARGCACAYVVPWPGGSELT